MALKNINERFILDKENILTKSRSVLHAFSQILKKKASAYYKSIVGNFTINRVLFLFGRGNTCP